jgi:hypothetical protein
LIDDPIEGGTVAEAIFKYFCGDAAEGEKVVVFELGFVFAEAHFFDAPING